MSSPAARDPLDIAMDDLAHALMCGELSGDCDDCNAARERLQQYRHALERYPQPGETYQVRTPKSKEPGAFWVDRRRVLSVGVTLNLPIEFEHTGSRLRKRCTLEQWNKWAKKATVIRRAD